MFVFPYFFLFQRAKKETQQEIKKIFFGDSNAINFNSLSGIFNTNGIYIKMNCLRLYDKWSTCVFNAQLLSFSILFPIFLHLIIWIKDNRFKFISPLTFFSKIVWRCHCTFIPSLTGSQTWQLLYVLNILKVKRKNIFSIFELEISNIFKMNADIFPPISCAA